MQPPFGAITQSFKLVKLRQFRGQQPAGPTGDGETQVVSAKCLISLSGHLLRPTVLFASISLDSLWCFYFFYFIKISKLALPGVILKFEQSQLDRKKERKKKKTST